MTTRAEGDPALDEIYDANAEYYDTITRTRVAELERILDGFAAHVDRAGAPVLDIGPGTGRLTARLARLIAPCELIAIEPTRSLRAILASRVADDDQLATHVTIIPRTFEDAAELLPERIGGVIALGVLPHLGPAQRQRLLQVVSDRLSPGAHALIEVMPPWTAAAVPVTPGEETTVGRHRVESFMQAQPIDGERLRWTMTYRRTDEHGSILHEARADSVCWVLDPDGFEAEARTAGLAVEWLATDLAMLSRDTKG